MAFVPEDGTGVDDANSYISVDYADEYFSDRGVVKWTDADGTVKETALINATDYINMRWGETPGFKGSLPEAPQGLPWPRLYAGDSALQMPTSLKRATAEYALRALDGPLAPDFVLDENGRLYNKKREEVGPIVEEVAYSSGASSTTALETFRTYPVPDQLIKPCLVGGGTGGMTVIRN